MQMNNPPSRSAHLSHFIGMGFLFESCFWGVVYTGFLPFSLTYSNCFGSPRHLTYKGKLALQSYCKYTEQKKKGIILVM